MTRPGCLSSRFWSHLGVHDETPLFLAVKVHVALEVHSKKKKIEIALISVFRLIFPRLILKPGTVEHRKAGTPELGKCGNAGIIKPTQVTKARNAYKIINAR